MSVTESMVEKSGKHPPVAAKEAVWVFKSEINGPHKHGSPALEAKCHGALQGIPSGMMGDSYALTTRENKNKLLPWDEIQEQVRTFRDHVQAQPERKFRILPSPTKSPNKNTHVLPIFCAMCRVIASCQAACLSA
jgi:hypothetical protein